MKADSKRLQDTLLSAGLTLDQPPEQRIGADAPEPASDTRLSGSGLPRMRLSEQAEEHSNTHTLVLKETIGRGGMGSVERAFQPELEREVAVKRLRKDCRTPLAVKSLLHEARCTGALEHPNIVPIHGLGYDEETGPLVVMKFIQGAEWSTRLAERPTPVDAQWLDEQLHILTQLCVATHFAHSRGFVHRDIKPANVMLGEFGEVYLVDWGLAFRPGRSDDRPASHIAGTPAYMAPEMVNGPTEALGPHTDIYLLGATLHEIITGEVRHQGANLIAALQKVVKSEPATYGEDVPQELGQICNRACHLEPKQRFADVLELKQAIDNYLRLRNAHQVLALTDVRVQELMEALEGASIADAQSGEAASRIQVLFHEALFGFEQAQTIAPHFEEAGQRREPLIQRMLDYEFSNQNLSAARGLLGMLEHPTLEHRQTLERLEERARQKQEHIERLELNVDTRIGRRQRTFLAITVAIAALAFNGFLAWRTITVEISMPSLGRLALIGFFIWVVVIAVAVIWRKKFLENAINRRFILTVTMLFSASFIGRVCHWLADVPIRAALMSDLMLFGLGLMLLRFILRSAYVLGGLCWAFALLNTVLADGKLSSFLTMAVTSIVAIVALAEWALSMGRQDPKRGPDPNKGSM